MRRLAVFVLIGLVAVANSYGGAFVSSREGLILERAQNRSTSATTAVESMLTSGTLADYRPEDGDTLGGQKWSEVALDENGKAPRRGDFLFVPVESDGERIVIMNAVGHGIAYVNGIPRAGDTYANGYVHVPVLLVDGENGILLRSSRGLLGVKLYDPPAPQFILDADKTLPDLVVGEKLDGWSAVVVVNATRQAARGLKITCGGKGLKQTTTELPAIPALSVRKVGFRIRAAMPKKAGTVRARIELKAKRRELSRNEFDLNITTPQDAHRRTFVSQIDGSVQYYSLREAVPCKKDGPLPGIVLTCHGASVEAQGQAEAYGKKSWVHLVSATNRRPYGFDWEDFGRADAMEVLSLAKALLPHDPARIYITGHSMGGHGAWHIATTFPDQFAAVGPSAGWISRDTYGGGRAGVRDDSKQGTPVERLMRRGTNPGRTLMLAGNLRNMAVYILHGAIDDNVDIGQAERMSRVLGGMHHDWEFRVVPGQKHWYGNEYSDDGLACVDWPYMFDAFARHALPPAGSVREVSFVTADPGVSSRCHYLGIEAQHHQLEFSSVTLHVWPAHNVVRGRTDNVAVLRLDLGGIVTSNTLAIELDGQLLKNVPISEKTGTVWFENRDGNWSVTEKPGPGFKNPDRYGTIKDELRHRFMFIYGTRGDAEENAWALAKARFDAETFWARGNGSIDIVADSDFDPAKYPDRAVVLYGNKDTNSAWESLLPDSPIDARRGEIRLGDRAWRGDDLATVFVRPRPDSDVACVIAMAGTGPAAMRSLYSVSFFVPFVRYPDAVITRAGRGMGSPLAAGFFGRDWSMERGEFEYED
ncbi:prolyl oligopeptidase family serine peptidase [bacterium]|nr:prolyl oligopeptidase family serine peptidase [bacterium]